MHTACISAPLLAELLTIEIADVAPSVTGVLVRLTSCVEPNASGAFRLSEAIVPGVGCKTVRCSREGVCIKFDVMLGSLVGH